jgi:hypothetical protein
MTEIRKVAFCPHCGNRSPQKLLLTHDAIDIGWSIPDEQPIDLVVVYFVATCETCNNILLYRSVQNIIQGEHFIHAELEYPQPGKLHYSVPESVSAIYAEAFRIMNLAPNAFAVQIRRALEALCEDRNARKGPLQVRLQSLSERGEIPPILAEVTDVLRLIGNLGAHAAGRSVKPSQVYVMDEFFRAVVEYVYIAPCKLKEFRDGLESFKSKSQNEESSSSA